jgi:probable rRNA maturation factor
MAFDMASEIQLSLQQPDARHKALLSRSWVLRCIRAALLKGVNAEITVRIVGAEEGKILNTQYRQKAYATNVLTFDYAQQPVVIADLVLCAEVIEREAHEQGKTLQHHYAHMLVHGVLHAQGWEHEIEAQAQAMEALEAQILAKLGGFRVGNQLKVQSVD